MTIVAAGAQPGWRRAALLYSIDDGAHWTPVGATAAPGVIGTLAVAPVAAPAALVDLVSRVEVELASAEMALAGADPAALDAGANLALLGRELLQFGNAEQIGPTRWRLSRLLRGRRATEAAIGTQAPGDRFALIEAEAAVTIDLPLAALGRELRVLASGPGDIEGPAELRVAIDGASVLPPAPVRLRGEELGDGDLLLRWVRRSRTGWRWSDGVDAPLGEERELYRVALTQPDGAVRMVETDAAMLSLSGAERAGGLAVAVRQAGVHGESAAARWSVPAWPDGGRG